MSQIAAASGSEWAHRTVEWHLRNIFAKLGIRSRHQLDASLARRGDALPAHLPGE